MTQIPDKKPVNSSEDEILKSFIKAMPLMITAIDDDNLFIEWNHECERVTGFLKEEIINNPDPSSLLYPDPKYFESLKEFWVKKKGTYINQVWKIRCKTEKTKQSVGPISPRIPCKGWRSWAIGLDVSELKDVSEKLSESENLFKTVYNSADTGIALCDMKGFLLNVNSSFAEMIGYEVSEIVGKNFSDFTHPDDLGVELAMLNSPQSSKTSIMFL
ncbi:MAG: PAS domain-containing protein [Ignavibacteriales bacterium]|nr:PAS domain-containing protein [Ignavibacteriales bacterium]